MAYHWPGNVRELQNVLKRMLVMGKWEEVVAELGPKPSAHADGASPVIQTAGSASYLAELYALTAEILCHHLFL